MRCCLCALQKPIAESHGALLDARDAVDGVREGRADGCRYALRESDRVIELVAGLGLERMRG